MKSVETKPGRVIMAKAEPGEDLIEEIIQIVKEKEIKGGLIKVIGAFNKVTLGYYDLSSKEYKLTTFEEDFELISGLGNIAFKDGEPIIHLHVCLGRRDYSTIGGHLGQPSIISVTGEIFILETESKLERAGDKRFDLSLLNL